MSRLLETYRAVHEQGFVPIFVQDNFDSKALIEGCLKAGCKCIEYTLRRSDAHEMIPWIRKNYPDLYLLVGSTVDNDRIINQMKRKHPQLMTLAQIAELDVDGFVSMLGWSSESIEKYCSDFVIAPTAMTVSEALAQITAGAHFNKLAGTDLGLAKRMRGDAAFDYCPIMITGGMTLERIPEGVQAGGSLIGAGFDLILSGREADISSDEIAKTLKVYIETTQQAKVKTWPELSGISKADDKTWLDVLPHYHPFQS